MPQQHAVHVPRATRLVRRRRRLRVYARVNLTSQAKRRDALLGANVHSLNATTNTPCVEATEGNEEDARELADALDNDQ